MNKADYTLTKMFPTYDGDMVTATFDIYLNTGEELGYNLVTNETYHYTTHTLQVELLGERFLKYTKCQDYEGIRDSYFSAIKRVTMHLLDAKCDLDTFDNKLALLGFK